MDGHASGWTRPRTSQLAMRSADDVGAAWDAVHRALPVGWVTSPPVYQQETRTWATHAHDGRGSRPVLGSREEAFGRDLPAALRALAAQLRTHPSTALPGPVRMAVIVPRPASTRSPADPTAPAPHGAASFAPHAAVAHQRRSYGHLHVVR